MRSAVTSARRCVSLVIPPWSSVIQTTTLTFEWQMNCCLLHACFEYRRCLISFQLFEKSWKEILVRTKDIRPVRQNFRQNNKQRHKECFHSSGSMKTRCPRNKLIKCFQHFCISMSQMTVNWISLRFGWFVRLTGDMKMSPWALRTDDEHYSLFHDISNDEIIKKTVGSESVVVATGKLSTIWKVSPSFGFWWL